jgi:hypothetical protein
MAIHKLTFIFSKQGMWAKNVICLSQNLTLLTKYKQVVVHFPLCATVTSHNIAMPVAGRVVSICTIPQAGRYGS